MIKQPAVVQDNVEITKLFVLERLASVFDMLGLLCPAVLPGKFFLQERWSKKYGWDKPLGKREVEKWSVIEQNLEKIVECKSSRCINTRLSKDVEYRLVAFCDALENAFACVIYFHQTVNGENVANPVIAKTRLAAKKIVCFQI